MKKQELTIEQAQRQIKELQEHIEFLKTQSPEALIKSSIKDAGLELKVYGSYEVQIEAKSRDEYYIKLPLPNANTEWTLSVYEWMKTYITNKPKSISAYPCHIHDNDNSNYLYIYILIH